MIANIKVCPKKIESNVFDFGNIKSSYDANSIYFLKDNNPFIPISGEFHFSRCDNRQWKTELLKMKASGINAVATYIFWNHHEYEKGVFNFDGDRDIKKFLTICREIDLPCVVRMGPWAHGECVYGGFPKYVQSMAAKRCDSARYLSAVQVFWTKLYEQISDFCDGKTVIGIQLENEYTGSISHIHTLRKLAIKIGFKTPFFTMTAWPTNTPDKQILPTFGGYPEAPWTWHKKPLAPNNRFKICEGRTETEIGEDLIKTPQKKVSFDDFPYAGCEVGVGNQVTQHRRPNMSEKDGYGVAFAKFASGMNWIGYYMYHGGRNPNNHLYQESRKTLYPNNYPIIDYDFQSPFSKDGVCRTHGNMLRLMHTFITTCDSQLATKQAYFSSVSCDADNTQQDVKLDVSVNNDNSKSIGLDLNNVPSSSVRCDENLSGYMFISNYERGRKSVDVENFSVCIKSADKTINLPPITILSGAMFFYPFNFDIADEHIDYILAQPITRVGDTYYFCECEGVEPVICKNGKIHKIDSEIKVGKVNIVVLPKSKALQFYNIDGKILFCKDAMFVDNGKALTERVADTLASGVELCNIKPKKLPYERYLFSSGKKYFYSLKIDNQLLEQYSDLELEFDFVGLNLQVFSDNQIIDDYFNTDGKYVVRLKMFKDYLKKNNELIIRAVAATSHGIGNVYNEINIPVGVVKLELKKVSALEIVEVK